MTEILQIYSKVYMKRDRPIICSSLCPNENDSQLYTISIRTVSSA
jgi:hypothetical protein